MIALIVYLIAGRGGGGGGVSPIDPFPNAPSASGQGAVKGDDTTFEFVKFVSKDVQDFWTGEFSAAGKSYTRATVVLFTGGTQSGCGPASESTGPFYCPLDHKVYLARNELDAGDTEEALRAAAAVGDDRLQQQAGQQVNPETWTHGSSAERTRWFRKGFDGGDPNACDTFSGDI